MASVTALPIPDPPPVQKRTLPLKRLGRKTAVISGDSGVTKGSDAIDICAVLMSPTRRYGLNRNRIKRRRKKQRIHQREGGRQAFDLVMWVSA